MQHLADGVTLDDGVEVDRAAVVETDVDGVGVAKQVMEVAKDFLVGAQQESTQIIRLAVEWVQFERVAHVAKIDELIDLAVRIAGDVAQNRPARRGFIKTMDRHNGKELVDGPAVRHGLENRKVAEISIRKHRLQAR